MPVLLTLDQAPKLHQLLAQANNAGLDCQLVDNELPEPHIQGVGSLTSAGPAEISFLSNPKLQDQLLTCSAAAVIMTPQAHASLVGTQIGFHVVLCSQPYLMYALLAQWFDQHRLQALPTGIHPTAYIHPSAVLEDGVSVGPFCVVEADVRIGKGTRLGPSCIIGAGSQLGRDGLLHARVTLYHRVTIGDRVILHTGCVLGADGFGFAPDPRQTAGAWAKIAQLGGVLIGDDVEIGANTTVDRGALGDTVLSNGVKLDNQIMVGHNVQIGEHSAAAACVGIAGSTVIGKRCTLGGAAMLSGHLELCDDVHVSGGTAITASIRKPGRYTGVYPFAEHIQWQRNAAVLSQMAQLRRRLRTIEKNETSD
ncbi:UDP-3-O-(3-hydroxymyristoyl)glucosamine N-acyltransferase [Alcaligenaceae bacterium]|nr:UDP-3-O-(3-hydroxymyristoyl)glucosamine N-acyltransferase [Alcaligenaceae bacterium]